MANTSRMNQLEELGRVDAEKAYTSKGKRNLGAEKQRVVSDLSSGMKRGGGVKKMASGGSASSRADGIASRGKTVGKIC